jgi:hypothetical protein
MSQTMLNKIHLVRVAQAEVRGQCANDVYIVARLQPRRRRPERIRAQGARAQQRRAGGCECPRERGPVVRRECSAARGVCGVSKRGHPAQEVTRGEGRRARGPGSARTGASASSRGTRSLARSACVQRSASGHPYCKAMSTVIGCSMSKRYASRTRVSTASSVRARNSAVRATLAAVCVSVT